MTTNDTPSRSTTTPHLPAEIGQWSMPSRRLTHSLSHERERDSNCYNSTTSESWSETHSGDEVREGAASPDKKVSRIRTRQRNGTKKASKRPISRVRTPRAGVYTEGPPVRHTRHRKSSSQHQLNLSSSRTTREHTRRRVSLKNQKQGGIFPQKHLLQTAPRSHSLSRGTSVPSSKRSCGGAPSPQLAAILQDIAKGGDERMSDLARDFGFVPLFAMTAHPMYNTFLHSFGRVIAPLCVDVLNGTVRREETLLASRSLCSKWRARIALWLRRFFVDNAVPEEPSLPSLPASLYHVYLYLLQIDQEHSLTTEDLQRWVKEGNVAQLAHNFPTLRDFYATVRTFSAASTCTRWRCQYGDAHSHPASKLSLAQWNDTRIHAGFGYENHLAVWSSFHERIQTLCRQLYVQRTIAQQLGDPWVEEAKATQGRLETSSISSGSPAYASDILDDRHAREDAAYKLHQERRLAWRTRTASAVGGNLGDEDAAGVTKGAEAVELTPEEEDERQAAMSYGTSLEAKLIGVLMTSTRFFYWGHLNLSMITSRTCVVVEPAALTRATTRVRTVLDHIMQIEPDNSVQVLLTQMIYQTSMACCVREDYLRRFTNQTRTTNPITVMNRSLSPENIAAMQKTFVGHSLKALYANTAYEYIDILHLCLWGNEMQIWTRIAWLETYCMFGNGFQDLAQSTFEETCRGRNRRPLVGLVAGQWCVIEGTSLMYLCRTSLEAVTLWMLLVWTKYDSETSDRMSISTILKRSFETDLDSTELQWLTQKRQAKWKERLDPNDGSIVWRRAPGPVQRR
jgi:hypothetical protein